MIGQMFVIDGVEQGIGDDVGQIRNLEYEHAARRQKLPDSGDDAAEAAWVPLGEIGGLDLVDGLAAFLVEHGVTSPLTLL